MAASVLLPTNKVVNDCLTLTASVTSATDLFAIDTSGFDRIAVQVTSAGTTCTITYEVSNDNNTWVTVGGYAPATPATETSVSSTSTGMLVFRIDARYFRARVSTYGSGTVTVYAHATAIYAT